VPSLFQLSYKEKTNFDLLKSECEKHKDSKEFFIQKAIGWALRDYSRFNPKGVDSLCEFNQFETFKPA
jgi:3-methyladenine DNA glycosylase AlkD